MQSELVRAALTETEHRLAGLKSSQVEYLIPVGSLRPWTEAGFLALVAEEPKMLEVHDQFLQRYGDRYPDLFTTKAGITVAMDMAGQNGIAVSNRVEGVVGFRVRPTACFTILRHWQVFHRDNRQLGYPVPLAFVAGISGLDTPDSITARFAQLVEQTVANVTALSPKYG